MVWYTAGARQSPYEVSFVVERTHTVRPYEMDIFLSSNCSRFVLDGAGALRISENVKNQDKYCFYFVINFKPH